MESKKYQCPKCEAVFKKDSHYKKTLKLINQTSLGTDEVVDFCGKCNHFDYEPLKV